MLGRWLAGHAGPASDPRSADSGLAAGFLAYRLQVAKSVGRTLQRGRIRQSKPSATNFHFRFSRRYRR